MTFGDKVLLLLKKKQMTQKGLAEMIHTTEASISRYINNERLPKGDIVAKIAYALDTTSDFLLSDDRSITLNLSMDPPEEKAECKFKEGFSLSDLTQEEKRLLYNYNQLSHKMKSILISMSDILLKEDGGSEEKISSRE